MKKIAASAFVLSLMSSVAFAADPVKIGFLSTFSGPSGQLGQELLDGFNLALEQNGKTIGGRPVEVITGDDQAKPDVGRQVADKMIEQNKVQILTGINFSNVMLAVAKPALDAGVFIVSSNAGPSQYAGAQCNPRFFAASFQNDTASEAMGLYLTKKGVKKIYLLAPNYPAGKDFLAGFKRTFKGEVVGEDYTKWPGQLDFSAELAKVRASNAEALHVFYPGASGVQFLAQYEQSGLKGKVPLSQVFSIDSLSLPQQKETALGVRTAGHWAADMQNDANKKFVGDFLKKHNAYPSFYGQQSYDTIMLIASAVEAVKGDMTKKDDFRNALRKANFKSTRGDFKYGQNHFPIQDFYAQEVGKDAEGRLMVKNGEPIFKAHQDPFAKDCKMKW